MSFYYEVADVLCLGGMNAVYATNFVWLFIIILLSLHHHSFSTSFLSSSLSLIIVLELGVVSAQI